MNQRVQCLEKLVCQLLMLPEKTCQNHKVQTQFEPQHKSSVSDCMSQNWKQHTTIASKVFV